jgi:hypothetical protein
VIKLIFITRLPKDVFLQMQTLASDAHPKKEPGSCRDFSMGLCVEVKILHDIMRGENRLGVYEMVGSNSFARNVETIERKREGRKRVGKGVKEAEREEVKGEGIRKNSRQLDSKACPRLLRRPQVRRRHGS